MSDNFIPMYDLESLNETQRQDYLKAVCKHMGVPDNLNLVALIRQDDGEGPARLVAYAKRGATENVRNNLQINVISLTSQVVAGSIVFTATAVSKKTGRQEISTGSKYIEGATGKFLDDAIMTAQTRALRRVTLQFVGAGVLDESEVNQGKTVTVSAPAAQIVLAAPQPTVTPSSAPGKDITPPAIQFTFDSTLVPDLKTGQQEAFEARQKQLRDAAIASLNSTAEKVTPEQEQGAVDTGNRLDPVPAVELEKPKRKYTRKPRTVDLGPSDPVIAPEKAPEPAIAPVPAPVAAPESPKPAPAPVVAQAPGKPRLSPEQVKPFRQRLFKVVNDHLEPNGFAPKEGMGNADKMRAFATMMFSDVSNMNELTVEQWEKYLAVLENKIKTEGAAPTIKYIEDSIGL